MLLLSGNLFPQLPRRCLSSSSGEHEEGTSGSEHEAAFNDDASATRTRILKSALHFVPEHGWSKRALSLGAEAEGLPAIAHGMFPKGGVELVYYFYNDCNGRLKHQMELEQEEVESEQKTKKKISIFIRDSVVSRLKMVTPYVSTWPQALGLMALPQNVPESLRHAAVLMDDIWYYAGDRSVDMNWYSKRVSLAAVYKSTELFMVQDSSENHQNTWKFLDRRLANMAVVGQSIRKVDLACSGWDNFVWGAFTTTRNILGMNNRNR